MVLPEYQRWELLIIPFSCVYFISPFLHRGACVFRKRQVQNRVLFSVRGWVILSLKFYDSICHYNHKRGLLWLSTEQTGHRKTVRHTLQVFVPSLHDETPLFFFLYREARESVERGCSASFSFFCILLYFCFSSHEASLLYFSGWERQRRRRWPQRGTCKSFVLHLYGTTWSCVAPQNAV